MVRNMKEILKMGNKMEKELWHGQMVRNKKDIGKTEIKMEKGFWN